MCPTVYYVLQHIGMCHTACNVFQHVVRTLVEPVEQPVSKELLQSSFDLLGELTKFNMEALTTLDKLLLGFNKVMFLVNLAYNIIK